MSRRSQRKRGSTAPAGSASKHAKTSPDVAWEWKGDGGQWNMYAPEHSQEITDALVRGDKEVTLKLSSGVQLKLRFSTMTQMNTSTGWQRDVRCLGTTGTSGEGVWKWQDENGAWNGYSSQTQRLLEACHLCGMGKTNIEAAGREYDIDLKAMTQVNEETGVKRLVQRTNRSSLPVWQWQDENSTWQDYDPVLCHKLEVAHTSSSSGAGGEESVSFTIAGRSYTVDVGKMEQVNTETGVRRKVARRAPKATPGSSTVKAGTMSTAPSSSIPPASSSASSSSAPTASEGGNSSDGKATRTFQGKVPVDSACTQKIGKVHVYCEAGEFWDATLNQTNLKNNNNKFYILQLLEDTSSRRYSVWFRWGRVGKTGQHNLLECGTDLDQAKQLFTKKFSDKTLNSWEDRGSFVKHEGKYDLLAMDYEAKDEPDVGEEEESSAVKPKTPPESKLDQRVQALIELICNVQAMEDAVIAMEYDTKKAPLGKLTVDQIRSGYTALKKIENCINRNQFGDELVRACDAFYTRIPHNFGMRRPPLIRTVEEVKEKLQLLEALGDIQIAMKVLSGGAEGEPIHSIDRHYHGLKCQLSPLDSKDDTFRMIERYVCQTHAPTHNQYRMEVCEVFEVEREGEEDQFNNVGNSHLLWHGSRLTNWVGILSQGLRIAPPEAPVTGYMFGKGVYFADMSSKSANYCFASRAKNEGLLILCDVALGKTNELLAADYTADKLLKGKQSTKGLGRIAPDPAQNETLSDGCIVPLGTSIDTGVSNPHGYTLNYNEYVVYDTRQIKMRYLVKLKFHFK